MSTPVLERPETVLHDEMLARFRDRAATYDRENRFFHEDFDELKAAGYLTLPVPRGMGGPGLTMGRVGRMQRQLAMYAPANAIAVNMHLFWVGLAADLHALGDDSCDWILRDVMAGEVFASGHAETGNDLPGMYSTTEARPADGGYHFYGRKSFGTLTPVWTRLGVFGMDSSDPANRKMVHGFITRDGGGFRIEETWDSLGMRATRSDDTVLEGAFSPLERTPRIVPTGAAGMDMFLLGMYAWAISGFTNVYFGVAKRALELAIESMQSKKSIAVSSGAYAHHPGYQLALADLAILCNAIEPHIDGVVDGYAASVRDAANWGPEVAPRWAERIVSVKKLTTEQSFQVVDGAVEIVGGFGVSRHSELERLFRDSRMGKIHPSNSFMTREMVSKLVLGLDFDAQPRWG